MCVFSKSISLWWVCFEHIFKKYFTLGSFLWILSSKLKFKYHCIFSCCATSENIQSRVNYRDQHLSNVRISRLLRHLKIITVRISMCFRSGDDFFYSDNLLHLQTHDGTLVSWYFLITPNRIKHSMSIHSATWFHF